MNSDNNQEMFPLVNEQGNIIGAATRGECHNGSKLLHPVIHLHVFNSKGELYLQKRPEWKDIQPGKWVHLRKSNTEPIIRVYSEAATPEAAEEIGRQIMKVIEDLAK